MMNNTFSEYKASFKQSIEPNSKDQHQNLPEQRSPEESYSSIGNEFGTNSHKIPTMVIEE